MTKPASKVASVKKLIPFGKLMGLMMHRRVVTVCAILLSVLVAVSVIPLGKRLFWKSSDSMAEQPSSSPSGTLSALTDEELREFAFNDRLPTELPLNEWTRVAAIREAMHAALREELPRELARRWQRDASQLHALAPQQATVGYQTTSGQSVMNSSQRGVLGVQITNSAAGLRITHIHSGSAASRSGLRVGDELLAINGRPVNSRDALVGNLHAAANSGGYARIDFVRNYARHFTHTDVSGQAAGIARREFPRH